MPMPALPQGIAIANTVRRILEIVREEYDSAKLWVHQDEEQTSHSLHKLVTQSSDHKCTNDCSKPQEGLLDTFAKRAQTMYLSKRLRISTRRN